MLCNILGFQCYNLLGESGIRPMHCVWGGVFILFACLNEWVI